MRRERGSLKRPWAEEIRLQYGDEMETLLMAMLAE